MPKLPLTLRSPARASSPQEAVALEIISLASPIVRLLGIEGDQTWHRNREDTGRIARRILSYEPNGEPAEVKKHWNEPGACVYFAVDDLGSVRHVGKSARRFADRWRLSPGLDATRRPLPGRYLYHSTCIETAVESFESARKEERRTHFDIVVARVSRIPDRLLEGAVESTDHLVEKARRVSVAKADDPLAAMKANVLEAWLRTARSSTFLDWNRD